MLPSRLGRSGRISAPAGRRTATSVLLMGAVMLGSVLVGGTAASAASAGPASLERSTSVAAVTASSGGMQTAPSQSNLEAPSVQEQAAPPSCRSIEYRGNSGKISVQTNNAHRIQWGITMYDSQDSVGRWDVDTYLNGRKTTSGFHRTTTGPYIPHGSLDARQGQRFHVEAHLQSANGETHHSVTNECIVP